MTAVGTRVVAIRDANDEAVNIYGYGTYVGEETPPEFKETDFKNPKIELENGEVVWGYQCWWNEAEGFEEKFVKGRPIFYVGIPQKEV